MSLASVANNQDERRARAAIMTTYPNTIKGQLQGLAHFTKEYIPAVKQRRSLVEQGVGDKV
jgi:hypothetical protein